MATYVAERGSSSDLSSDSDEDDVSLTEMSLNLRGTKEETRRTVAELIREEEKRVGGAASNFSSNLTPNTEAENVITVLRWTQEMHDFYDRVDEEAANFDMEAHFKALEYDPDDWKIGVEDKYRTSSSGSGGGRGGTRYYLGGQSPAALLHGRRTGRGRCRNCNEVGHYADECAEPEKDLVCRLCAAVNDHQTDYCSDQVCLRCGSREGRYDRPCRHCLDAAGETCPQCGVRGHLSRQCPDNWRRYHDTTVDDASAEPQRPAAADCHKRASEMFCVNCGRKGHYLHHCHAYQHRNSKPLSVLKVCSYENHHQVPSWMKEDLEEESGKGMSNRKRKKLLKEVKRRRKEELQEAMRDAEAASSAPRKKKRKFSQGSPIEMASSPNLQGQYGQNWNQFEPLTSRQKWRRSIKLQQQTVRASLEEPRAVREHWNPDESRKPFGRGEWKTRQKSENRLKAEALKTEFKMKRGFGNRNETGKAPTMARRQAIRDLETEIFKSWQKRVKAKGKRPGFLQACEAANLLVGQLKTKTKKKLSAGLKTKVSAALEALKFK